MLLVCLPAIHPYWHGSIWWRNVVGFRCCRPPALGRSLAQAYLRSLFSYPALRCPIMMIMITCPFWLPYNYRYLHFYPPPNRAGQVINTRSCTVTPRYASLIPLCFSYNIISPPTCTVLYHSCPSSCTVHIASPSKAEGPISHCMNSPD